MNFSQQCLIMSIENNEIDWTLSVAPGEYYTKEDVNDYCDKQTTDFYVYPINNNNTFSHTMDYINEILKTCRPLDIPGMFTLT